MSTLKVFLESFPLDILVFNEHLESWNKGELRLGDDGNQGRDIFGGLSSLLLVILLLTEFALWMKVAKNIHFTK